MTNQQLIQKFEIYLSIQQNKANNTVTNYIRDINQFFDLLNNLSINNITDHHIFDYLDQLKQLKQANQTIYRKMVSLNQFWNYLMQKNYVRFNPWASIKRPKNNYQLPVFIEEHIMLELLNNYPSLTSEDVRNKAILELLFASGIRVSELTKLKLDDLNLQQNECRVLGKGNKFRIALFGTRANSAIQFYCEHVRHEWVDSKNSFLFISKRGGPLTVRTVQRILKQANNYHSSPIEITPHSCRHTCASLLISNGAGIRDVQEFLGHSSITTTERYTHIPTKTLTKRFLDAMN